MWISVAVPFEWLWLIYETRNLHESNERVINCYSNWTSHQYFTLTSNISPRRNCKFTSVKRSPITGGLGKVKSVNLRMPERMPRGIFADAPAVSPFDLTSEPQSLTYTCSFCPPSWSRRESTETSRCKPAPSLSVCRREQVTVSISPPTVSYRTPALTWTSPSWNSSLPDCPSPPVSSSLPGS